MLHSVKYKIPAVIVMSRDEALADRRRHVMENVLDSPLPPDKKIRVYESTLARRLNEEDKLIDTPLSHDEKPVQNIVYNSIPEVYTPPIQDTNDYAAQVRTPPIPDVPQNQTPVAIAKHRPITHHTQITQNSTTVKQRRATLPPKLRQPTVPNYMKPLKRRTDPSSASLAVLRPNRPPKGHFTGKGRLSVVRW